MSQVRLEVWAAEQDRADRAEADRDDWKRLADERWSALSEALAALRELLAVVERDPDYETTAERIAAVAAIEVARSALSNQEKP